MILLAQPCDLVAPKVFFFCSSTVIGDNINIMKTTFELNFDFYQALNSIDTQKYGNREKLSIKKSFSLITCKLVKRKKLVNN